MEPIAKAYEFKGSQMKDGRRRLASPSPSTLTESRLERACSEFASIFSYSLIKNMRSTIPKSTLLKEAQGKKLIESIMDQKMAQYLSSKNGFGIKELLIKTLACKNINSIK